MYDVIEVTTLYIKDNTGALRFWSISAEQREPNWEIIIEHGILGGSIQEKHDTVKEGKQGRSIKEQAMLQMSARISKQRDKGYTPSIKDAETHRPTNQLGLIKPMLAQPSKKVKVIGSNPLVQYKYDGHRCLVDFDREGNWPTAYSRNGKPIDSIDHIINQLVDQIGSRELGSEFTLDGELYLHGLSLQKIASLVKRKQLDSLKLTYIIYDIIEPNSPRPYRKRLERLKKILSYPTGSDLKFELALTRPLKNDSLGAIKELFTESRKLGYEGLIIRHGDTPYEDGKRSKSLVKVKGWEDDEFFITGVTADKDGRGVLHCRTNCAGKKPFKVLAPGTNQQKRYILENLEDYVGKMIKVEFANYTAEGIPFHPVAIEFRNKEAE